MQVPESEAPVKLEPALQSINPANLEPRRRSKLKSYCYVHIVSAISTSRSEKSTTNVNAKLVFETGVKQIGKIIII
jgi:hypothetical protein